MGPPGAWHVPEALQRAWCSSSLPYIFKLPTCPSYRRDCYPAEYGKAALKRVDYR